MNPLTNVKNLNKINEIELNKGYVNKKSWHDIYKDSAWIFIGGLAYGLTEGDILSVFSQYGEIVNLNVVRDKKTGKTKGFCFLCYASQKSTILAVDNFNGIKLCGRTIRVDHVANYKPPKDNEHDDEVTRQLKSEGCAPKPLISENISNASADTSERKKSKKSKKEKKKHKKRKKVNSEELSLKKVKKEEQEEFSLKKVKKEKLDTGYAKYEFPEKHSNRRSNSEDSESSSSDSDCSYTSKKEKHKSAKTSKSCEIQQNVVEKGDKTRTNEYNIKKSDHKRRHDSSSDSDNQSTKRVSHNLKDHANDLPALTKYAKYNKVRSHSNSSSDEYYEKHEKNHPSISNEIEHNFKDSKSHHHNSSSNSESESTYRKKTDKKREKYSRRDSIERENTFHKYKRYESSHYHNGRDDRHNESTYERMDHYQSEKRDGQNDSYRKDDRRKAGKRRSDYRERKL
ncbi:RNA-binding motif protein, X-linked 2 [Nephila pilipes]|uniref:RNA-binding motif protein, X-linked 2 n=1 Tax=Nephila pilipes TaxID=299642 RepID=A0A8X6N2P7_NEPPI|nr:RNA-binding motif protein, X-linked 2 [Nephila pilipes]